MADVPDGLVLKRHRDLEGMGRSGIWVRRAFLALIALVAAPRPGERLRPASLDRAADVPAVSLAVYAPTAIRGGDFMEARFHITAKRDLKEAILKLDPGWAEGMSWNSIQPSPVAMTSDDGRFSLDLGRIKAGHSFLLFLQFQVNPTNVAWHRPQNVELDDGHQVLARIHRTITVFP